LPVAGRAELCCVLFLFIALTATAQETTQDFRPRVDLYVNQGSRTRLLFRFTYDENAQEPKSHGSFASYVEFALRPVFRRELRRQEDVFRQRYLTFRAGYQYTTSFLKNDSSSENRAIAELTARYPVPYGIVITDRNRGDFRFVKGQPFSARYRNRLRVERDLKVGWFAVTPYVYDEIFYDTRYDAWSTNRIGTGAQFPAGPHVVVEPYVFYQVNSHSSPRRTETLGLTLSFYF
jgi:hypothetical protein